MREQVVSFYKLAHLHGNQHRDLFACAARRDGLLVVTLTPDGLVSNRNFKGPGLDLVDVCSLGSAHYPFAAACPGADHSLHLSRDVVNGQPPQTLRLDGLRGAAYSLLHTQGYLFLVISDDLYIFLDFASSYLSGTYDGGSTQVREILKKAVDAYLAHDRLLVVMPDMVLMALINELASGGSAGGGSNPVVVTPGLTDTCRDTSLSSGLTFAVAVQPLAFSPRKYLLDSWIGRTATIRPEPRTHNQRTGRKNR